uniref:Uncharacterized protein n=1 Tax=Opuntia streptacantha TaxID=393608 RepID=A0A7C9E6G7_OPUST
MREYTTSDPNHPQKLIDIITRIAHKTSEYNEDVFNIQGVKNFPCCLLWRRHGSSNSRNVSIVPGIIVNNDSTVSHGSSLVSIVPPRCHFIINIGVVAQPGIRLSEIIKNMQTLLCIRCQNNRRS